MIVVVYCCSSKIPASLVSRCFRQPCIECCRKACDQHVPRQSWRHGPRPPCDVYSTTVPTCFHAFVADIAVTIVVGSLSSSRHPESGSTPRSGAFSATRNKLNLFGVNAAVQTCCSLIRTWLPCSRYGTMSGKRVRNLWLASV
jgi:hypothetical protein